MNYIIIGNGIAGIEAAFAIRKNDPDGTIKIISSSEHLHYYRPNVIEYLGNGTTIEKLIIYKKEQYKKKNIENILQTTITKINPSGHTLIDASGATYRYDRLLLATGAYSFVPPVRGSDCAGVFTLRGITDANKIKDYCRDIASVVVVGGGLLGLESAYSLVKLGKKVTVVEFCKWLLPRQLDKRGGEILARMLSEKGLSFVLDDSVLSIEGNGRVEKLVLKSGREISAGAVVFSAGIRCRTALAKDAGIAVNNGIIVDDYMRTSAHDVYAAGDPAEHRGRIYGIWPAAKEQGRIAGMNMAGIATEYSGTLMANTLKITGIDLYSAGNFEADNCDVLVTEDPSHYKKFIFTGDNPVGAIVLGDREAMKIAQRVIEGKAGPGEFKKIFSQRG